MSSMLNVTTQETITADGVIVDGLLKTSAQCSTDLKKANKMLGNYKERN